MMYYTSLIYDIVNDYCKQNFICIQLVNSVLTARDYQLTIIIVIIIIIILVKFFIILDEINWKHHILTYEFQEIPEYLSPLQLR